MPVRNDNCRVCKGEVKMMVRRFTGICSEGCEKKEKTDGRD